MAGARIKEYVDIATFNPEVTGSCNLLIIKYDDGKVIKGIVDCGLFQEREYSMLNQELPFDPKELDFVLVTHNHVDHIGRLPVLKKKGYQKNIYMTNATQKLIKPALYDSCKVLRSIAKRENTKPLYNDSDVEDTVDSIIGVDFEKELIVAPNVKVTFLKNGHLVGAALILVTIHRQGYNDINMLFTGDYSKKNMFFDVPELPEYVKELPLTVVQESTYGDMDSVDIKECFEYNILKAIDEKKSIVVPVFSLGRSQEILYILKKLQTEGKLSKDIPIYFDGKLAIRYTDMYIFDEIGIKEDMENFLPENLTYVYKDTREDVLSDRNCKIIVTTSGMGSYGPAQMYIPEYLSRRKALIHFTGYTAEGTLGYRLKKAEKNDVVDVAGLIVVKRADVEYTTEFSAHAKADEMIDFLKQFKNLKLVLLNHGDKQVKEKFAKRIVNEVEPKYVGILGDEYIFRIDSFGLVKTLNTNFY